MKTRQKDDKIRNLVGAPRTHSWQKNPKSRPCVIISPAELDYLQTRIIAPITSKGFEAPYRIEFELENKKSKILCDQMQCVNTQKFVRKIGALSSENIKKLDEILKAMFE